MSFQRSAQLHHASHVEAQTAIGGSEPQHGQALADILLHLSSDGIALLDDGLSIWRSNAAFQYLFACTPDDIRGRLLVDMIHMEDIDQVMEMFRQARSEPASDAGDAPLHAEVRARRQDGHYLDVALSIARISSGGWVCSFRDISSRKEEERMLRYYAVVQKSGGDAVIVTDLAYRIQSWNRAAEKIYGWSAAEVIGHASYEILQTGYESEEERQQFAQVFFDQGAWQGEVIQQHKDGSSLHIQTSLTLLREEKGEPYGIIAVNRNITLRKQALLDLRASQEALRAKLVEEREFQRYLKALHEIIIELTQIDELDEFYRRVVELGLARLGFERLGLLLFDPATGEAVGTYGSDPEGRLFPEHHLRLDPGALTGILKRTFERSERFTFDGEAMLYHNFQPIGMGWNAVATLWNGKESLGWLAADNGVHHRPATKVQLDILALYSLAIGALLARKRAEVALRESEEKFRLLMESAPEAIVTSNRHGVITLVNAQAEQLFGYSRDELVGQPIEILVEEGQREIHEQSRQSYAVAPRPRPMGTISEIPARRKDGTTFPASIGLSCIETHGEQWVISFIVDISERKKNEDALRQAFEKERELNELKSRFVSMASHEFRTPLATILAATDTLSAYWRTLSPEQVEKRLEKIREHVGHLKNIMDDVLQLARMQARKTEFNPVRLDLDALCRSVLDEFQSQPEVGLRLHYHSAGALHDVRLDKKLMRQIINNLVSNAIKYSPAGAGIEVRMQREGDEIHFSVRDQGIGIPEVDLQHLFEPFHRAGNVGAIAGTGLGLTIVKESVELHGGAIEVQSQAGVGTTFQVVIPLVREELERGENPGG